MKKVSDEEILNAILEAQIKRTAKGTLDHYIGGSYAVVEDDDFNRQHSCQLSSTRREELNAGLSNGQLLNRLKSLAEAGEITRRFNYAGSFHYTLSGDITDRLFDTARDFWLTIGIPLSSFDHEKGCMRTKALSEEELEKHITDCIEILKDAA
jgi:hypothetical protein